MNSYDVTALGELLIDFTQNGFSDQGNPLFEANPGGAPCNVLALLQKMGRKTAFIGKVGNDSFGNQLKRALEETGISEEGLFMDEDVHTTLAIVQTKPDGDRDFSFYRRPGADMMLTEEQIPEELIRNSRIFHYGTLSMTDEPVRSATRKAIAAAEEAGLVLSFDPNLRPPLWNTLEAAREQIHYGLAHCHILKISDDEITWLTNEEDYGRAAAAIRAQFPQIRLLLVSLGKEGSLAYYKDMEVCVKPFLHPDTIETTGAGDTFMGSILHKVLEKGLDDLNAEDLTEMLTFANAAASLITRKKGALRVMPELEEIEAIIRTRI